MGLIDWIPFASTLNHMTKDPQGIYPEDYIGCDMPNGTCVEGDPVANAAAIRHCEQCIADKLARYSFEWCGIDGYVKDAFVDIAGVLAAFRGLMLMKSAPRAGVAWTGIGAVLLADGLIDMYFVFEGLDKMRAAAEEAKRRYCRCP